MVPKNISLIVGVPRSGLLAANILALHLNLPLTDIQGLIENRIIESGERCKTRNRNRYPVDKHTVLVVDDSVATGNTMRKIKYKLSNSNLKAIVIYCGVYVSSKSERYVDFHFEQIQGDRVFEWNLMNSWIMGQSCTDLDGVLCEDPTEEENDDGERYKKFIMQAKPLLIPSRKMKCIVTCRLEKYRSLTEEWLKSQGIEYGSLVMMDFPDKEARLRANCHAAFKAQAYNKTQARLFIESSLKQAVEISKISSQPVLCIENQQMVYPKPMSYGLFKMQEKMGVPKKNLQNLSNWIAFRLMNMHPPNKKFER
jgi:uncharacterized HAD superfamily protein